VVAGELPGGEVVTTLHTGSYASLPMATAALREWMIANGRQPSAGPCEVYLDDPQVVPEVWLRTEVFFPLR
jgi:effector-binding domain-containing protein